MSDLYAVFRLGPGGTAAERQLSAAYLAGAVLALIASFLERQEASGLRIVGGVCLVLAAAAWWLPWQRWHPRATLALALPAFGFLAWSIVVFGPDTTTTAAFFVLLFAWAGLHHPPLAVLALTPAAVAASLIPTLVSGIPVALALYRSLVVSLIMVLVGLVIADRVDRLERAKARLARAEQWRTALMLSMAHDIRTPLSAVRTTLQMMSDGGTLPPAERGNLTALALQQTERLQQLTAGLMELEQVESGQVALQTKELALQPVVHEAVQQAGVPGVVVRTEPRLWVRADPAQLAQILVNLLVNAKEHGRPPIVVVAGRAGDYCEIAVRDHGEGVPAGHGAALFARLVSTDQATGSVGLGVWAARQLAIAHGGDLRYESADPGARFVLTLPAVDPTPPGF